MSAQSPTASSSSNEPVLGWNTIQDRLRDSIVAIQSSHTFVFDTDGIGNSNASGFVVDAEKGLILSNRHVMYTGPSYHKATFFNNIEVYLQPRYYDPIHDFAFFSYDPSELKGFKPKEVRLAPELAYSGMEFRILGNNCNEKMSVHSGELSQLDRNPPALRNGTSDQNIFYIQASSTTNGGSSGSPVVNIEGHAVAMNAAGRDKASASYFVSLERAAYALKYLRNGEIPPRGTMQTVFKHITFTQADKLGLSVEEVEKQGMDTKDSTGVLTVANILPEGPADGKLHVGDILISINSVPITKFCSMADIVDSSVNKDVEICVFSGGTFRHVSISVQDFYSITPSKFLVFGGALVHDMSYRLACIGNSPVSGVAIRISGYGFLKDTKTKNHRVIYSVNGKDTPNLDAFIDVLRDHPRNKPIVFKARMLSSVRSKYMFIDTLPRTFSMPIAIYTRSSKTGIWSYEPYAGLPLPEKTSLDARQIPRKIATVAESRPEAAEDKQVTDIEKVMQSNVKITSHIICPASGNPDSNLFSGSGLVISHKHGIVVCSTALVSNPTAIVTISFNGIISIPATVAYSHPLYPVSFLKYSPELLDNGPKKTTVSELNIFEGFEGNELKRQDSVSVVFNNNGIAGVDKANVLYRRIYHPTTCECCTINHYYNIEGFVLSNDLQLGEYALGIVCNSKGKVAGLCASVPSCKHKNGVSFLGLDISLLENVCKSLTTDSPCSISDIGVLDVEFKTISLEEAEALGVDESHTNDIWYNSPADAKQLFVVNKTLQKRDDDVESLQIGDVILKVDGQRTRHITDLAGFIDRASVELTVVRDMQELVVNMPTTTLVYDNARQVVFWAGFFLQEPWQNIKQKTTKVPSQVFSFCSHSGSSGNREAQTFQFYITEINDKPISSMDDLVSVVKQLRSKDIESFNEAVARNEDFSTGVYPGCDVKIRLVKPNGVDRVITVRTNDHYLPAWQAKRGSEISDAWEIEYF